MLADAAAARAITADIVIFAFIFGGATMFFVKRARRRQAQGKRWYLQRPVPDARRLAPVPVRGTTLERTWRSRS